MKATELQCYDLINVDGRETRRVYGMMADSDRIYDEWQNDISANRCNPIPLTADLLKKNGCTMIDKGDYGEWHIKENPNIPLWQHTEFVIFGGIQIHFVHQFQHALRLCGLTDLADGFQI